LRAPDPPAGLLRLQRGFGSAISTPFEFTETGYRTCTESYPGWLGKAIEPRPDKQMTGADRLAVYNQQYWFRLFSTMQKELPLLCHLMGSGDLNKLSSAYLSRYPPETHDLRDITRNLEGFLAEDTAYGLEILRQAARLDRIHVLAFDAPIHDALAPEEMDESILSSPLTFQPCFHLFSEDWNLVEIRRRVAGRDDACEADPEPGRGYWAVWRSRQGVVEERLGPLQYHLADLLGAGRPLAPALGDLLEAIDGDAAAFLEANLQGWLAEWTARGWLCKKL